MEPDEADHAVNSMFQWYRNAEACYAYLWDVRRPYDMERSDWFTRGWTLQELLAPEVVVFFSGDWTLLGHKRPSYHIGHDCNSYGEYLNLKTVGNHWDQPSRSQRFQLHTKFERRRNHSMDDQEGDDSRRGFLL